MFNLTGGAEFGHKLAEAQKALKGLDGELGTVSFDPNDPGSIEGAVQEIERLVDERLGAYASNTIIGPITAGLKERYREAILERAAAARLEGGQS